MYRVDEDAAPPPTSARTAKAAKARFVRRLRDLVGVLAFVFWGAWGLLAMSWTGHRPMVPTHSHPYAYTTSGLFYVSAGDLNLSHALMAAAALMVVAVAVLHRLGQKLDPDFDRL